MTTLPDPRVHCRHYYRNPPPFALAVDEPWWWAVLYIGADLINVHFQTDYRGPLAIVSRPQKPWHYRRDCDAIEAILKGARRPTFDAWRCPKDSGGKIVGLVDVVDCQDDASADGLWFVGPYALKVEKQCLLPVGHSGSLSPRPGMIPVDRDKQDAIAYALTAVANGRLQPGVQR